MANTPWFDQPLEPLNATADPAQGPAARVVMVGNFDGVHAGHRRLIAAARHRATQLALEKASKRSACNSEQARGQVVAVSFHPHPVTVLRPQVTIPLLTSPDRRREILRAAGADVVRFLNVSADFLQLSARQFFDDIILGGLQADAMVEGPNFHFGKDRQGDADTLRTWCAQAGLIFDEIPLAAHTDDKVISSSQIRDFLTQGNVRAALGLLGRPHQLTGTVVPGQQRGRQLQFPTANLANIAVQIPAPGVYAGWAQVDQHAYQAAVHVGPNPTFDESQHKVEVHLLDFSKDDLYGKSLSVDFYHKLRDVKTFEHPDHLRTQLTRDVSHTRQVLPPFQKYPSSSELAHTIKLWLKYHQAWPREIELETHLQDHVLTLRVDRLAQADPWFQQHVVFGLDQTLKQTFPTVEQVRWVESASQVQQTKG